MNDLIKDELEDTLRGKQLILDAEAERRLKRAVGNVPAETGSTYSPVDHLKRLADVFRTEEERCVGEAQSILLHVVSARVGEWEGDVESAASAALDAEATRIRDRFSALWDAIGPPAISPLNSRTSDLQAAASELAVHAESARTWRGFDLAEKIRALKGASDLYEANMRAAIASRASASASEDSAKAAKKMVIWTALSALGTLVAAIATAIAAWHVR